MANKTNVLFLCCANRETFVADTKCFLKKSETFFVSATNVVRADTETGKHLCPQHYVRVRHHLKTQPRADKL